MHRSLGLFAAAGRLFSGCCAVTAETMADFGACMEDVVVGAAAGGFGFDAVVSGDDGPEQGRALILDHGEAVVENCMPVLAYGHVHDCGSCYGHGCDRVMHWRGSRREEARCRGLLLRRYSPLPWSREKDGRDNFGVAGTGTGLKTGFGGCSRESTESLCVVVR